MATHVPFQEPDVPSAQWSSAWICVARSKLTDGSLKEWPGVTRDKLRVHVQPTMMRRYHWCEGPAHVATRQMPNCGGTQSALGSAFVGALRFVGQPVWYRFRLPVLLSDVYLLQLLLSYWYWYSQVGTNILICTYLILFIYTYMYTIPIIVCFPQSHPLHGMPCHVLFAPQWYWSKLVLPSDLCFQCWLISSRSDRDTKISCVYVCVHHWSQSLRV